MTPALAQKLPSAWTPQQPEAGWHRQAHLQPAFRHCRSVTREHARSFYFSSFPLPRSKKLAAFAVYAFCRYIDDIIDEGEAGKRERPSREILREELVRIEAGTSTLPFAPAFAEVNRQFGIDRRFYEDLIEGCCRDREPADIQTYEELELYCYYVASVVGLMMSHIFGLSDVKGVQQAVEMGVAMQLTNILRDVREDWHMGRIYLPAEERERFGITDKHIEDGIVDDAWRRFMAFQVERTRRFYAAGARGLALLSPDGSRQTATLMARVYAGILDEIEKREYDVFSGRVFVPTRRKLRIALKTGFRGVRKRRALPASHGRSAKTPYNRL
ncbi:MAG: phytoene/squalene synthase family protein [Opitutales bacterium]